MTKLFRTGCFLLCITLFSILSSCDSHTGKVDIFFQLPRTGGGFSIYAAGANNAPVFYVWRFSVNEYTTELLEGSYQIAIDDTEFVGGFQVREGKTTKLVFDKDYHLISREYK
jgi:hypothetical protein